VKRAYFMLSKEFHPDSLFGRRLGTYKQKMESVFKLLTEAHDVLAKPKRRKEYDDYLAATAQTRRAKDILARGDREVAVIEQVVRASMQSMPRVEVPTPMPASEPPSARARQNQSVPPPRDQLGDSSHASLRPPRVPILATSPDEQRRAAQQALRRRLQAATGRPASSPPERGSIPPTIAPPAAPSEAGRGEALRGLASSLRAAHAATGADRIKANVERAQQAEAAKDFVTASNFLRLALAAAPARADLQRDLERVSAALASHLADSYEKQAHYEERAGRWKEAAEAWGKVCEGRPNDPHASRGAAHALLRGDGDLHAALKYAKHHVEVVGENAANLTLLARVYLGAGLKLNARRELEKAAKLDPSDDMIKNLLKEAR
jgi:tetratricopeptide (TPR) repeat protein